MGCGVRPVCVGREEVDPPGCWMDGGICVGSGVLDPPGCCKNEGICVGNGKRCWKDEGTCVCWNGKLGGAQDGLIKYGLSDEN